MRLKELLVIAFLVFGPSFLAVGHAYAIVDHQHNSTPGEGGQINSDNIIEGAGQ